MLKTQNLTYTYPSGIQALKNVSLSLNPQQITALVGHNGAGKSTLMRCLAGLEESFLGSITYQDQSILPNLCQQRNRVGFLRDFYGHYADLSVRDALEYFAKSKQIVNLKQSLEEAVALCHLQPLMERKRLSQLSRGQKQKVGLAQAIIAMPEYLFLDEPASGLDPLARNELGEMLGTLKAKGITLLVSSHILTELQEYADHLLIMKDGELVSDQALLSQDLAWEWMQVELANPDYLFVPVLDALDCTKVVKLENQFLLIQMQTGKEHKAQIMKSLLSADAEVMAFSPISQKLKDLVIGHL
jgi:ABC-2 type transport system ATP-binding protein